MRFRFLLICYVVLLFGNNTTTAQHLKPYFDPAEYSDLLKLVERMGDTPWTKVKSVLPPDYKLVYRAPESGLQNRWDLWTYQQRTGIIVIRGTNGTGTSWLENFYAGMIPAQGTVVLNDSTKVPYRVAKDSAAYVHAGWMLAVAAMGPGMIEKINQYYRQGIHDFIIFGHSQGGVISLLMRSYFEYNDQVPKDITFKTYASAAPKPGNLNYAYDFDYITRGGWALRVVNADDWVPETPFSIQTTKDFVPVSPFMNVKGILKKQKFPVRSVLSYMYGRLDRPGKRASRRMQRILGKTAYKRVKKVLPEYARPGFVKSHSYMPAGIPVILYPVEGYIEQFPFDGKNIFIHHSIQAYRWELEKIYKVQVL